MEWGERERERVYEGDLEMWGAMWAIWIHEVRRESLGGRFGEAMCEIWACVSYVDDLERLCGRFKLTRSYLGDLEMPCGRFELVWAMSAIWNGYVGDFSSQEAMWAIWRGHMGDLSLCDLYERFELVWSMWVIWSHKKQCVGDLISQEAMCGRFGEVKKAMWAIWRCEEAMWAIWALLVPFSRS